ncbi:MAG TPA: DUF2867 domain-containing protein [Burkholderiaceae bacterium]|nr:DUF2867 domain-containing protein [Burkholderiaceae bacterium]
MNSVETPTESRVQASLPGAYFHDTFEIAIKDSDQTALELYLSVVASTPGWIKFLMRLRNRIVVIFGLKNLGDLGDINSHKSPSEYQVGQRVGIFSILSMSDQELVLGDDDKHLNAQVSIYKYQGESQKVAVTTVVHIHNFLGRAYLFFVVPMHKLIVPAMLTKALNTSR